MLQSTRMRKKITFRKSSNVLQCSMYYTCLVTPFSFSRLLAAEQARCRALGHWKTDARAHLLLAKWRTWMGRSYICAQIFPKLGGKLIMKQLRALCTTVCPQLVVKCMLARACENARRV